MRQTMLPSEILFVEDASDDEGKTLDKLHEIKAAYIGKIHIKILCMVKNGGPGEARNFGWTHALQPYIAFLDADDAWHSRKIEIQYLWMKAHPDVALSCHETILITERAKEPTLEKNEVSAKAINGNRMLFSNSIPTRSVMIKTSIHERFIQGMRFAEDYHLWTHIIFNKHKAYRLLLPLAFTFKAEFSVEGLSGNLYAMRSGEKLVYKSLLLTGHISHSLYLIANFFSYIKFCRRLLIMNTSPDNAYKPT